MCFWLMNSFWLPFSMEIPRIRYPSPHHSDCLAAPWRSRSRGWSHPTVLPEGGLLLSALRFQLGNLGLAFGEVGVERGGSRLSEMAKGPSERVRRKNGRPPEMPLSQRVPPWETFYLFALLQLSGSPARAHACVGRESLPPQDAARAHSMCSPVPPGGFLGEHEVSTTHMI